MNKGFNPHARRKARQYALQAIYQWQMAGSNIGDIEKQFLETINVKKVDADYFSRLLRGTLTQLDVIDEALESHMEREMEAVDPVERAILRLSAFELKDQIEVPYRVVINEALELAKGFGATDGFKFVNGVLDKAAKTLRSVETGSTTNGGK